MSPKAQKKHRSIYTYKYFPGHVMMMMIVLDMNFLKNYFYDEAIKAKSICT